MSGVQDGLFREAALKRLNNPDDLDRMVRVTRPLGWLAGLVLGSLIVGIVAWSIVGRLPSRVVGTGILLPSGGQVTEIEARGAGVLMALLVRPGDKVTAGQIVGRIGQTEGERDLLALQATLADRTRDLVAATAAAGEAQVARAEVLRRQRAALDLRVQNARNQERTLTERLATNRALYAEQLVIRQQVIQTDNDLAATRQDLSNAASDGARLGADDANQQRAEAERLQQRQREIDDLQQRIATARDRLADTLAVRSGLGGTVIEVRAQQGSLLRAGQAILEVEEGGSGLEVVSFVDTQQGKEVQPGMEVRSALSSARREDYGMLVGRVESVSAFPLSYDAVLAVIQNEDLARAFMKSGPPFMVKVALDPNQASASGYRWTSRRGDGVTLSSGMSASVEVVTEWRRPIGMVIPALRDLLGD